MLVQKIRDFSISLKQGLNSSNLSLYFLTVISFFFILSNFSAVRGAGDIEDYKYDSQETYRLEQEITCLTNNQGPDCDANSENVTKQSMQAGLQTLALMGGGTEIVAADFDDSELPLVYRKGLIGIVEDGNHSIINNSPTQNVYAHMVEEWVPGYSTSSTTSVYAASGYDILQSAGIADMWQQTRIIAYALFVVVLIAAGFMVMFRQKIGGQMAVTVFNTIPQIVLGLLLVTFSFAIVGIIINLGSTVLSVIAGVIGFVSPSDGVVVEGPFTVLWSFITGDFADPLQTGSSVVIPTALAGAILNVAGPAVLATAGGAAAIIGMLGLVVLLAVIFIIAVGSVKVYVTLIKAFVGIIIDAVLGPLFIAFSVVPGKKAVRSDWLKRLIKNALTFPLVYFFLNLSSLVFSNSISISLPTDLTGGTSSAGGAVGAIMQMAISIYLIYLAAESPKFIDEFLPVSGGKSTSAALQEAAKGSFGKIPLLGTFVK